VSSNPRDRLIVEYALKTRTSPLVFPLIASHLAFRIASRANCRVQIRSPHFWLALDDLGDQVKTCTAVRVLRTAIPSSFDRSVVQY
jgi:hypothetical protein